MKQRCTNPNAEGYAHYGGRGITVCARWMNSFYDFLADMGEKPAGATLDRFPNKDGDYEPSNCRWATYGEQNRNTNRNVEITHNGETLCVADWAARLSISASTIAQRVRRGCAPADALTKEPHPRWSNRAHKVYTYDGRTQSLPAWAKEYGVAVHQLYHRVVEGGWPIEQALTAPKPYRDTPDLTAGGVTRPLPEWAKLSGLTCNTIRNRLDRGWPQEDAVLKPCGIGTRRAQVKQC